MPRGIRRGPVSQEASQVQTPEATNQAVSPRAAEMRRERRRRKDGDLVRMGHLKLAVPQEIGDQLKSEGKVWRWILDTSYASAHADDWDKVEGIEPVQANPVLGTEERLILCSKYADWQAEDTKAEMRLLDEGEKALVSGRVDGEDGSSEGLHVPKGQTNRISRERGL